MKYPSHMVITDLQVKPDTDLSYVKWIAEYIIRKRPDVIICLGDFTDCPSLCSYDKGKKSFEGRRYRRDIAAAREAMDLFLGPIKAYNEKAVEGHRKRYKPRMVMTLGNHEQRIERVAELQPELEGVVSYDDLPYGDWEVIPFLEPIDIDGVMYVHYLSNPFTGKPYVGTALNQLTKVGKSFIVGHKQTLDICTRYILGGQQQWGIVAGAGYPHDEGYKGPQGNHHWRGIIYLHRVLDGSFDPMLISLDYLKEKYEEKDNGQKD